jgi:hypothetical protein
MRTARSTLAFRQASGSTWPGLLRAGLALKRESGRPWSSVALAANTPMLIKTAMVDGRPQDGVMATGQVTGLISSTPSCLDVVTAIVNGANDVLGRLASAAPAVQRSN